jgi:hypothetical protein
VYRYFTAPETFVCHDWIEEDIARDEEHTFPFIVKPFQSIEKIEAQLDSFKQSVLAEIREVHAAEFNKWVDPDAKPSSHKLGGEHYKQPHVLYDYIKTADGKIKNPDKLFKQWQRCLDVFDLTSKGHKPLEISKKVGSYKDYDLPNSIHSVEKDLKTAHKLIESAVKGSFPK